MKFVLFNDSRPGLLRDDGVVDISDVVGPLGARVGQEAMEAIISHIDDLRADLLHLEQEGMAVPLSGVSLLAPLPRPSKILCMGGNYREFGARESVPMWGFRKSSEATKKVLEAGRVRVEVVAPASGKTGQSGSRTQDRR